ncbi:LytTR family DNA-binding domain-containing protein [uncultured Gemmiger sp.]|uniref:LytR/AlgR family response regulator transcription factor n=1 Tax=uncultured Gemmiger sp. TaxID=1623490 RepID=UPI0025FEA596|nr:LytTR family DNA-binding domain-containing protein [uncultured Gemmiger sp.]
MPTANLSIAVCDDSAALLARVELLLQRQLDGVPHTIRSFTSASALLEAAALQPFQLAVLDIQLPQQNGITLAQRLQALRPGCQIIFLTAYVAYCQDVYDVDHIAFVLKEEMDSRLPVAVARACARQATPVRPRRTGRLLMVGPPGAAVQIPQEDILYLERRVRTTWLHTIGGEVPAPDKLEPLLARLDPVHFCQTHKSFAIHWPFVERYGKTTVRMTGGVEIPISRSCAAAVRQSFLAYVATLQPTDGEDMP